MRLGVCYYPEQWPREWWADDAQAMAAMGIKVVRLGEFAWSRMEPEPGRFDWGWLDEAVETLAAEGLRLVLGTPTATPPKWLIDRHPEILAWSAGGQPRAFGSRRHYDFSSDVYRQECRRIVEAMSARYGRHPAVEAWQTDNEYGCHDTTISYSPVAAEAFRHWLKRRYNDVASLNAAWGTVFWSQEYRDFEEVDPPNLTVTEANPAHRLDYNRFASDQVVVFNRLQADILRRNSPGRDIIHNFMGFYTEFDHFEVGADLDVASWDSYPLGFLEQFWFPPQDKARYLRQGHPDIAAFHHDLYRGCGRGRWWVMEQQPGPVNWAAYNPAPLPGMVRAWTWEAFAHGAEVVSYFRWRQAPFAQEQFHAGLHLPDRREDVAADEARQVVAEIAALGDTPETAPAKVALVFSYEADWLFQIQPQGRSFRWLRLAFETYTALRRRGLDVDIVEPGADLAGYRLIVLPSQPTIDADLVDRLRSSGAVVLLGPRTGSRTRDVAIPDGLPPGPARALIDITVRRVESLRPGSGPTVLIDEQPFSAEGWSEVLETSAEVLARFEGAGPAWVRQDRVHYLATWPTPQLFDRVVEQLAKEAGLTLTAPMADVRLRRRGALIFAFNYGPEPATCPAPEGASFVIGGRDMAPAGVAAWRHP